MRAIIETGGKQFAVAPKKTIRVPSLAGEPGDEVTFDRVLYVADDGSDHGDAPDRDSAFHIGSPAVKGATVTAEIVKHGRGKKITVYKFKRRKRYRRKQGHRQNFTELRITGVTLDPKQAASEAPAADTAAFTCEECGKEYKTERGLTQHLSREHGIEQSTGDGAVEKE